MNKRMLRQMRWRQCILEPSVQSIFPNGRSRIRDWSWIVLDTKDDTLTLQNMTTGHILPLPFDSIAEYRENIPGQPSFLILRSQVRITACDVSIRPILHQRLQRRLMRVRTRR